MKMKVASLKRFNKTNKPLDRLTEKTQITQVRNENGGITTYLE